MHLRIALAVAVIAWALLSCLLLSLSEPFESLLGAFIFLVWFLASVLFLVLLRRIMRNAVHRRSAGSS
jgi:hypothetical protein